MTTSIPPICLSGETRSVLSKLDNNHPVHSTIRYGDVIVGVSLEDTPPAQLVLPAGLEWTESSSDNDILTVGDVLSSQQTEEPLEKVTLRMRMKLTVRDTSSSTTTTTITTTRTEQAIKLIDSSSLLIIDDVPFTSSTPLISILSLSGDEKSNSVASRIYKVNLYISSDNIATSPGNESTTLPEGPVFTFESKSNVEICDIDVLAHVAFDATLDQVRSALKQAVERYMNSISELLSIHKDKTERSMFRGRHFAVLGSKFCVTYITQDNILDETSTTSILSRKAIHITLGLPQDRPMLRKSCQLFENNDSNDNDDSYDGGCVGRLSNVHEGLKSPANVYMIQGRYLYCHYMQNGYDDNGWGCAYRSLQTLISWCVFQHYATFPSRNTLPTHNDIQRALVDIGDKPHSFIGTKEWIGANEVCYVLEKLTGLESRIVHVTCGANVAAERGRDFEKHFQQHGTPIMIGGGVLAWTMLGIARDEVTGKCKFLILDPHYKGRDHLPTIQNKGWVAWKGEEIFDKSVFYNFCLPQRPNTV